jgi:hypothetical protein
VTVAAPAVAGSRIRRIEAERKARAAGVMPGTQPPREPPEQTHGRS